VDSETDVVVLCVMKVESKTDVVAFKEVAVVKLVIVMGLHVAEKMDTNW
jgi:hypothetical protein